MAVDPEFKKAWLTVTRTAYEEGRRHQRDYDFPDVGFCFDKTFEDTNTYKILEKGDVFKNN